MAPIPPPYGPSTFRPWAGAPLHQLIGDLTTLRENSIISNKFTEYILSDPGMISTTCTVEGLPILIRAPPDSLNYHLHEPDVDITGGLLLKMPLKLSSQLQRFPLCLQGWRCPLICNYAI